MILRGVSLARCVMSGRLRYSRMTFCDESSVVAERVIEAQLCVSFCVCQR